MRVDWLAPVAFVVLVAPAFVKAFRTTRHPSHTDRMRALGRVARRR